MGSITPINEEVSWDPGQFIVSKTDLKGRITYANRTFMRVADFHEAQLLGQPHNIIRHPDMPKGVFRLMWSTIKRDQEFFGFVKNLTASGRYYWVFAQVTPSRDHQGQKNGYYSVRRIVPETVKSQVSALYAQMRQAEQGLEPKAACEASLMILDQFLAEQGKTYLEFAVGLYRDPSLCAGEA